MTKCLRKTSQGENGCTVNASCWPVALLFRNQTVGGRRASKTFSALPRPWMASSSAIPSSDLKASQSNLDVSITLILAFFPPVSPKLFEIPAGRCELWPGSHHPDKSFTLSSRSLLLRFLWAFLESAATFLLSWTFPPAKSKNFSDGKSRKFWVLVHTPAWREGHQSIFHLCRLWLWGRCAVFRSCSNIRLKTCPEFFWLFALGCIVSTRIFSEYAT